MSATTKLSDLVPIAKAQAGAGFTVSAATLSRWCRQGRVPAVRVGGRWMVEVEAFRRAVVKEVEPQTAAAAP